MEKPIEPSLEIRINSVEDAKSVVRNMKKIEETCDSLGLRTIEFLVAQEIKNEVNPIIYGVFRRKTFTAYTAPRSGNVLFSLPHFHIAQRKIVDNKPVDSIRGFLPSRQELPPISEKDKDSVPILISEPPKPKNKGGRPRKNPAPVEQAQTNGN